MNIYGVLIAGRGLFQVCVKPGQRSLPGIFGRIRFVDFWTVVVKESVFGVWIMNKFMREAEAMHPLVHFRDSAHHPTVFFANDVQNRGGVLAQQVGFGVAAP